MATKKGFFEQNKAWIIPVGILAVIAFIILMWFVGAYNGLISTRGNVDRSWANVETQYQRRLDLIPNLVETVAGFATQERTVFEQVTQARSRVGQVQLSVEDLDDPAKMQAFQNAQSELGGALSRLLAVAENYPELKSSQNFLALQDQLEGTENRIATARRDYNDAVYTYNVMTQRIPTVIVANMFGFDQRQSFEAQEGADVAPSIDRENFQ